MRELNFGVELYVNGWGIAVGMFPFFWRFGFRSFDDVNVLAFGPFRIEAR